MEDLQAWFAPLLWILGKITALVAFIRLCKPVWKVFSAPKELADKIDVLNGKLDEHFVDADEKFGKIEKDEVDMDAKMVYVENLILMQKHCSFRALLEKQNSKMEIIVTFLVILELMKIGKVLIEQEDAFEDIYITSKEAA